MTDRRSAQPRIAAADAALAKAIRLLGRTSVLVVGDVMLDRYVYGTVERVSPEAPVPILTIERELAMPGGAGNVVRNLVALGTETCFISVTCRGTVTGQWIVRVSQTCRQVFTGTLRTQ